jgi:hypothetical protein
MFQAIAVWAGTAVALGLLLVMALGPVIVEADSWWFERRHRRRRRRQRRSVRRSTQGSVPAESHPEPVTV